MRCERCRSEIRAGSIVCDECGAPVLQNIKGFANTAAQTVSMGNVVSIAQKECTLEWQNTAVVFYDEGAKVWKVELGFSQDHTVCQTVYLSSEGITLLVVSK